MNLEELASEIGVKGTRGRGVKRANSRRGRRHKRRGALMAPKRKAGAAAEPATEQISKLRKTIDDGAEELLCPITQELPIDPVTAEDGRVYERSAITEWLQQNDKSPHTNEPMGKRLLPATQVKNLISGMVKSGAITGDKAGAWTKKLEGERVAEEMRRRAEAGDARAMAELGHWYRVGKHGLQKNLDEGYKWAKRAADLDHPRGISNVGACLSNGSGTERNTALANVLFAQAATMGVDHACYLMAEQYKDGDGLPKDLERAQYWAKKALDDDHVKWKCMPQSSRAKAARWAEGNFEVSV